MEEHASFPLGGPRLRSNVAVVVAVEDRGGGGGGTN
jgi:hypothetical protein